MSDLVARLRDKHCCDNGCHCDEAADEIERLRDAVARGNKTWNALSDQCDAKDAEIERLEEVNELMLTDIRRTDVDMLAFKARIAQLEAALRDIIADSFSIYAIGVARAALEASDDQ